MMRVMLVTLALGVAGTWGLARAAAPPDRLQVHPSPRPVPALEFVDDAGRARSLEDFHGRVVVLNVWATWCAPCRVEMPTLDALQAALGGPDFEVVALSVDRDGAAVVRAFYEDIGIERLAVYVDPDMRAPGRLAIPGIPATLVIDPQGREVARLIGAADWNSPGMQAYLRDLIGAGVTQAAR